MLCELWVSTLRKEGMSARIASVRSQVDSTAWARWPRVFQAEIWYVERGKGIRRVM